MALPYTYLSVQTYLYFDLSRSGRRKSAKRKRRCIRDSCQPDTTCRTCTLPNTSTSGWGMPAGPGCLHPSTDMHLQHVGCPTCPEGVGHAGQSGCPRRLDAEIFVFLVNIAGRHWNTARMHGVRMLFYFWYYYSVIIQNIE